MKCDKLKAEQWLDYSGEPRTCYPQKDVDSAIDELRMKNTDLKRALYIAKAERFKSGFFHFDLEKDFWADRDCIDKEKYYYKKREQCARLEAKCRERAKRFV